MLNDTDVPEADAGGPDIGFDTNFHAPPARFERLTLCVAAASALAFGVVGTVAYGVWFNQDQQAYADAMTGARQALGAMQSTPATPATPITPSAVLSTVAVSAPTAATAATTEEEQAARAEAGDEQASWSGQVMQSQGASSVPPQAAVARAAPAAPASSVRPARGGASSFDPAAQRPVAAGHAGKDARVAQQNRRSRPASARHNGSLFTRVSLFFRRVNYRQHGTGRQQDPYAHS